MLFSSIPFLYFFLPITLIIYFLTPKQFKNITLLVASFFFYAWGEPIYVLLMLLSIVLGYVFGILIEKFKNKPLSRAFMVLSVALSICVLMFFKYTDFFISNFNKATGLSLPLLRLALPIGISFYTFQILSYTIDVYRGTVSAQKSFVKLATYISLFPQLIAGPIVRYSDIEAQLSKRSHSIEKASYGIRRFVCGLAKKVLIANTLGELCGIFDASNQKSVLFYWIYAIAFSLQIYFDFSGYSDMAIGIGKILGFDFSENFNYPYISKSITEFWRRWHISLGSWFRDYVYIPLGGNRVKKPRFIFNILLVWLLTGFWHGAAWGFALWGVYFGVLLIIEKFFLLKYIEKAKILNRVYLLFLVLISFVIFNAESLSEVFSQVSSLLGLSGIPFITAETVYYLKNYAIILLIAIIGATPLMSALYKKIESKKITVVLQPLIICILILIVTAFLVDGSFNPFLYFRF